MAGTITIDMPDPIAVVANVVTGLSSIPSAIFEMVFAVQGEISNKSTRPFIRPHSETCSVFPVN